MATENPEGTQTEKLDRRSAGGEALYEKYGADHMRRIGAKGTETVQKRYGLRFYSEIARRKRGLKRGSKTADNP